MRGKRDSGPSQPSGVVYCYDESLPPQIGEVLAHVGYPVVFASPSTKDELLIPEMGAKGQTWITKDNRSRTEHGELIEGARVSVVWIRGLSDSKRRRGSIQRTASMKDILRMLVNQLDRITDILENADTPRYFLLYMVETKKNDQIETFTSLREVGKRLAG